VTVTEKQDQQMKIPDTLLTSVDLARLLREIEGLDEFLTQAAIRQPGSVDQLPRTSKMLEDLANTNGLSLLHAADRKKLAVFLKDLKTEAPIIHISFSAEASAAVIYKISSWFRANVHPLVLLQIGMQPNIAAGCVVRSSNKYFDFTLRKKFEGKTQALVDSIKATQIQDVPAPAAAAVPAAAFDTAAAAPAPSEPAVAADQPAPAPVTPAPAAPVAGAAEAATVPEAPEAVKALASAQLTDEDTAPQPAAGPVDAHMNGMSAIDAITEAQDEEGKQP
jgi:hypothetical protein